MSTRIVFFDGNCNLCNGFVDFLIRRKPPFMLSSLQGESAQKILPEDLRTGLSTVVYCRDGRFLLRSEAVAMILWDLGGVSRVLAVVLKIVPGFIGDGIYGWISKRRYHLFGKRDSCRLPSAEEKSYFLP